MNWKNFLVGLLCGVIISFILFYLIGNRYTISSGGPQGIRTFRLDKWTGKSWRARYIEKEDGSKLWYWEEIKEK